MQHKIDLIRVFLSLCIHREGKLWFTAMPYYGDFFNAIFVIASSNWHDIMTVSWHFMSYF